MAVRLNDNAYEHAQQLVAQGKFVRDERDAWSEHQPATEQENRFIEKHGFAEYAKWFLGVNDQHGEDKKSRYEFPYGDFEQVHRCGLLSAESRAAQYKHSDIARAAHQLHEMIDPG